MHNLQRRYASSRQTSPLQKYKYQECIVHINPIIACSKVADA
ncbi:MAG: hypothetical protein RMY16_26640 [Nostoc sp. DedQUE12b]|nr:hypothetical protein [Nostoc sp. DedQUE12b]MDZ8089100.1 hypothetical protein [Nostoc sp. DedQUE12b]